MKKIIPDEKLRDKNAEKYTTGIFQEIASETNPFSPAGLNCFGYNQLELAQNLSYPEYLYLLLMGDLPDARASKLLNRALIAFSNPGPRHPASRAAVSAAVGKTVPGSVLPAALLIMTGKEDGAGAVIAAMKELYELVEKMPSECLDQLDSSAVFGLSYGSSNEYFDGLCRAVQVDNDCRYLKWGERLLLEHRSGRGDLGWKFSGLVAAVLCELDIKLQLAPGLLQLFVAPGLLVHGMENARRSPTVLPFVKDEDYEIESLK